MTGGILYLDVDDEITSAAARIRTVEGRRVAIVLPPGSRVSTSRINFRLLARDALTHEKRLSIVAADAGTRALAASAGLPVFASVGEYEASEEAPKGPSAGAAARGVGAATAGMAAAGAAAAGAGRPAPPTPTTEAGTDTGSATVERPGPSAPAAAAAGVAAGSAGVRSGRTGPTVVTAAELPPVDEEPPIPPRTARVERPPRPGRGVILAGLGVLVLAAIVGGVAAYLLLPSATAVVTARPETIGPLTMTIVAATDVAEPDVEGGIVPAENVTFPVEASDTFRATGKRVEQSASSGSVRFINFDPTSQNTIAKGAIVSTSSGIRFRTASTITIPPATFNVPTVTPSEKSVRVTAIDPGPDGNVAANTITTVPQSENDLFLDVTNPDPTSGGKRQEFPRVTQKDVDKATKKLTDALTAAFQDKLDDPDLVSDGQTVFADTAALEPPTFSTEPADLVGQEIESFDLGASANGTVTAVDEAPVETIAEQRLASSVDDGYTLVPQSGSVTVDEAVVSDGTITFPVVATARQVRQLDPADIQAAILGKTEAEARAILDGFGTSQLTLWPDWVTSVPTMSSRVEVRVDDTAGVGSPAPSGGPTPSPSEP
jgi:hypothetical protein